MRRHRVAIFVRDGLLPMELGIVHQLFGSAQAGDGQPLYEVLTCALQAGHVRTTADVGITVPHGVEAIADCDTLVIPASQADYAVTRPDLEARYATVFAQLKPTARVASICTGAFLSAAAGLLDGRRATTHWRSAEHFRSLFPKVSLDPDVLYVDEGHILTSAGEAAGIDLCLHMIRRDHGAAVAADVARRTVVPPHREGGQVQFIPRPIPEEHASATAQARAWAVAHLDRPIALRELAAREAMSVRTFTRRFRQEVGTSPSQWLAQQRMSRARQLLEETDHTIDQVAAQAGFGTAASLRQQMHAALGVSPRSYRKTFRGSPSPS